MQNFHLMDYHLATFITVMLARRLVWAIVSEVNTQHCILIIEFRLIFSPVWVKSILAVLVPQFFCQLRYSLVQVSQSSGGSLIHYVVLIAARLSLLTMCGWVLCWTLVNLCKNHSVLNLLFLGYPWVFYPTQPHTLNRTYLKQTCLYKSSEHI